MKKKRAQHSEGTRSEAPQDGSPLIVGVGASAGGLTAFRTLLKYLPADTGMAFVLVQHLDPQHESLLPELLTRSTRMPVVQAEDGQQVAPNYVYVIPPNRNLAVLHGELQLLPREETSKHLPVDHFLRSLAEDRGSQAIGVILSGTASDGTLGLKAIKAAGGITFAQDETSAEYAGMPHSAIAAGCVDFILPPERIAEELAHLAHHPLAKPRAAPEELPPADNDSLKKIFLLLRSRTGTDFTYYKHSTIKRRIKRRLLLHKLERIEDYVRYLQQTSAETDALFQDILINVTEFFRDPEAFQSLKDTVFPHIMQERPPDLPIRIWIPGCSSGEEAYSVAIALLEHLGDKAAGVPIQIFATDIDATAIDKARVGVYAEGITAQVSPERLRRFFTRTPAGYQIGKSIRDLCVFAVQDVNKDPPFSRLDLIVCRNLLIYLDPVLQKKLLRLFHYALRPHGFLLLGSSETVGGSADLFSLMDKKNKLYAKKAITREFNYEFASLPKLAAPVELGPRIGLEGPQPIVDLQQAAERVILAEYGPPGVIVNADLEILHFRGRTGPYLEPGPGAASLNLFKMVRQELLVELRAAVHKALKDNVRVRKEGARIKSNSAERNIALQVLPLAGPPEPLLLVLFEELPPTVSPPLPKSVKPDEKDRRIQALEHELHSTREYMQSIIEDQEATNEELKSANEEIQSTNEELQSTNEELETAKEELQSINEELATVNEELENRNLALAQANNDLTNVLASVELPIVMLDSGLKIRHFTPAAKPLLNLLESDVGRPIGDLRPNLELPDLQALVPRVMSNLNQDCRELRDEQGHWYSMRIRPYKTLDNRIEGVVITFIDIDQLKGIERLREALQQERRLAAVVRDANDAILLLDFNGRILAWNRGAEKLYGYTDADALALNVEALAPEEDRDGMRKLLARLKCGERVQALQTRRLTKDGRSIAVELTASAVRDEASQVTAFALTERALPEDRRHE